MFVVYRYRVKSLNGLLNSQARAVSFVWNFCNDRQKDAIRFGRKWLTSFDLQKLTAGAGKELGLHSATINQVCAQYAQSRQAKRRPYLRYRGRDSLGWVPFRGASIKSSGPDFIFCGSTFRVFDPRPLPEGKVCDGSNFSRDARGNWFLNIVVQVEAQASRAPERAVGIDLGLKDLATLSTGEVVTNPRHFSGLSERLARAQRAKKKQLAANIHARIANARRDHLHKLSARIVRDFDYIAVGNVNAAGLAKTSMGKSVNDASWSTLRFMLRYKAIARGAWYEEVNERFSTQTCSRCGSIEGPKGVAGLGIRQWVCGCGAEHHRDVNAAVNLLARSGHRSPVEGALTAQGRGHVSLLPHG